MSRAIENKLEHKESTSIFSRIIQGTKNIVKNMILQTNNEIEDNLKLNPKNKIKNEENGTKFKYTNKFNKNLIHEQTKASENQITPGIKPKVAETTQYKQDQINILQPNPFKNPEITKLKESTQRDEGAEKNLDKRIGGTIKSIPMVKQHEYAHLLSQVTYTIANKEIYKQDYIDSARQLVDEHNLKIISQYKGNLQLCRNKLKTVFDPNFIIDNEKFLKILTKKNRESIRDSSSNKSSIISNNSRGTEIRESISNNYISNNINSSRILNNSSHNITRFKKHNFRDLQDTQYKEESQAKTEHQLQKIREDSIFEYRFNRLSESSKKKGKKLVNSESQTEPEILSQSNMNENNIERPNNEIKDSSSVNQNVSQSLEYKLNVLEIFTQTQNENQNNINLNIADKIIKEGNSLEEESSPESRNEINTTNKIENSENNFLIKNNEEGKSANEGNVKINHVKDSILRLESKYKIEVKEKIDDAKINDNNNNNENERTLENTNNFNNDISNNHPQLELNSESKNKETEIEVKQEYNNENQKEEINLNEEKIISKIPENNLTNPCLNSCELNFTLLKNNNNSFNVKSSESFFNFNNKNDENKLSSDYIAINKEVSEINNNPENVSEINIKQEENINTTSTTDPTENFITNTNNLKNNFDPQITIKLVSPKINEKVEEIKSDNFNSNNINNNFIASNNIFPQAIKNNPPQMSPQSKGSSFSFTEQTNKFNHTQFYNNITNENQEKVINPITNNTGNNLTSNSNPFLTTYSANPQNVFSSGNNNSSTNNLNNSNNFNKINTNLSGNFSNLQEGNINNLKVNNQSHNDRMSVEKETINNYNNRNFGNSNVDNNNYNSAFNINNHNNNFMNNINNVQTNQIPFNNPFVNNNIIPNNNIPIINNQNNLNNNNHVNTIKINSGANSFSQFIHPNINNNHQFVNQNNINPSNNFFIPAPTHNNYNFNQSVVNSNSLNPNPFNGASNTSNNNTNTTNNFPPSNNTNPFVPKLNNNPQNNNRAINNNSQSANNSSQPSLFQDYGIGYNVKRNGKK